MEQGDEIIVPANTYVASVLSITDNGLIQFLLNPTLIHLMHSNLENYLSQELRAS